MTSTTTCGRCIHFCSRSLGTTRTTRSDENSNKIIGFSRHMPSLLFPVFPWRGYEWRADAPAHAQDHSLFMCWTRHSRSCVLRPGCLWTGSMTPSSGSCNALHSSTSNRRGTGRGEGEGRGRGGGVEVVRRVSLDQNTLAKRKKERKKNKSYDHFFCLLLCF